MCYVCEQPCWRDGGERECVLPDGHVVTDEEFRDAIDLRDSGAGAVIDLMERLQYSLNEERRRAQSAGRAAPNQEGDK